jgi:hypothetical protein
MKSDTAFSRGLACVVATVVACSGCGGGGGSDGDGSRKTAPRSASEREHLRDYERAAEDLVDTVEEIGRTLLALQSALEVEDDAETDAQLDALPDALDRLEDASDRLQRAEEGLAGNQYGEEPGVARASLGFLPVLVTLAGLASFAEYLRGQSEAMNEQRNRRDDACSAIADNEPGAIEACQDARDDMAKTGTEVIERMTEEVVTELVLSPVEPTSVGGLILKEAAGEALQGGMTVLTSTEECGSMPPAEGCRVGIARTGADGETQAPAGVINVSVSGNGRARVELDEVELGPDEVIELILDLVDIEDDGDDEGEAGMRGGEAGEGGRGGDAGVGTGGRGGESGRGGAAGSAGGGTPGTCSHPEAVGTHVPVDVDIETQADIDALAGCTSVGGLEVGFSNTEITTLDGLESLTEVVVVGDRTFPDTPDVFSGSVRIDSQMITDISALANLTRVEGRVQINAPLLREVDLGALRSAGEAPMVNLPGVSIGGALVSLIDLSSLETVTGDVHFTAEALDTLLLTNLRTISAQEDRYDGGFIISSASRLAVLELPALTSIDDQLWVYWCDALTAIDAPQLTRVRRMLRIEDNPALPAIGLDSIVQSIGDISILNNTALESIGLNGITDVTFDPALSNLGNGGVLRIEYNPVLQRLGFAALTSISGELHIATGNDALTSEERAALQNRVTVGGGM